MKILNKPVNNALVNDLERVAWITLPLKLLVSFYWNF